MNNRAIVLISGGLDSATVLRLVAIQGYEIYAMSFNYGQKHLIELEMAKKLVQNEKCVKEHKIISMDLKAIGGSSLTDENILVPKTTDIYNNSQEIPNTYVPARNTIFLSYALAYGEVKKANHIFIGANAIDYSGYPDCRPEYLNAFEKMANLGSILGITENSIKVHSPLLYLSKKQIIQMGLEIGVDYANTISCYDARFEIDLNQASKPSTNPDFNINKNSLSAISCGKCDACRFRLNGFAANNIKDPIKYLNILYW